MLGEGGAKAEEYLADAGRSFEVEASVQYVGLLHFGEVEGYWHLESGYEVVESGEELVCLRKGGEVCWLNYS